MASANAPLEFTGDERETVNKLALMMKGAAVVLLVLAGVTLIGGLVTLVTISPAGLLAVIEGLVTGLLGLIMLSSSADVRFMVQTKFTSIHFGNALRNLTVYYKTQLFLALFLTLVMAIRIVIG